MEPHQFTGDLFCLYQDARVLTHGQNGISWYSNVVMHVVMDLWVPSAGLTCPGFIPLYDRKLKYYMQVVAAETPPTGQRSTAKGRFARGCASSLVA